MSLADQITQRKAQERADAARRADQELEAKLDRFIAENPRLREHGNAMSKDELFRKLMLAKMESAEMRVLRNQEVEQWVRENPDIGTKIVQRLKNTVAGTPVLSPGVIPASVP
jgi:hypothetical protein